MPFSRPTLPQLLARAQSDLETRLAGTAPRLRWTSERVITSAQAGLAHELHGHLVWLAKQIIPDTAEGAHLARWAAIYGIFRKPPTQAQGPYLATGAVGAPLPGGTRLQRADGTQFTVDTTVPMTGVPVQVQITAVLAGAAGNCDTGTQLALVGPVAGVQGPGTVDAPGIGNGLDTESDPALLARLLYRLQHPPKAGARGDYVGWAISVPGITRAWETYPNPGYVSVYAASDTPTDVTPSPALVTTLQTYLDSKRPVTSIVTAYAVTKVDINPSITMLPNNADQQAAAILELKAMLLLRGGAGVAIDPSWLSQAISETPGWQRHTLNSPLAPTAPAVGQISTLGTPTWP